MKKILCFSSFFVLNIMICHSQVYYVSNFNVPTAVCMDIVNVKIVRSDTTTKEEGAFLNEFYSSVRSDFDFIGKKIAFFRGSSGTVQYPKWEYFRSVQKELKTMDNPEHCGRCFVSLYIFTQEQKKENGGYDAAIVQGSKRLNSIKTVVKRLNRYSSKTSHRTC